MVDVADFDSVTSESDTVSYSDGDDIEEDRGAESSRDYGLEGCNPKNPSMLVDSAGLRRPAPGLARLGNRYVSVIRSFLIPCGHS